MTSIVDTSVKLYTSDMANAPALTNANGSLVALLDAVLKDGFDVKAITSLTVAAGVATLAWTGSHSAIPHAVIVVSGVTGGPAGFADMNGEQKVQTKPSASSCTFFTAAAIAEIELREGYEGELRVALGVCVAAIAP